MLRFLGFGLMIIGSMIASLCGLCTCTLGAVYLFLALGMAHPQMNSIDGWKQIFSLLAVVFITGVLPTAIGVALMLVGWKLDKTHGPPRPGQSQDLKT